MRSIPGLFRSLAGLLAILALIFAPQAGLADSWLPPEEQTIESENGEFRFTVVPAPVDSALRYFSEEIVAEAEGEPVERPAPMGLLERRSADGNWQPIWAERLVNAVSPVSVLVANDGTHVVTFDNWHSVGHGDDAFVIYDGAGRVVRALALTDLVSEDYKNALPHSVSSLAWKTGARIVEEDNELALDVLVPGTGLRNRAESQTVEFRIALADGAVTLPPTAQWDAALAAAETVMSAQKAAEEERLAYLRDPLVSPQGCEMRDWNRYLREAFMRTTEENPFDASTSVTILLPTDNPRHAETVGWLTDRMTEEWDIARNESFAAPCGPGVLAGATRQAVNGIEPGAWSQARFYFATTLAEFEEVKALVSASGAEAIWIDPDQPIMQRPERMPGSDEMKAAMEDWEAETAREMREMLDEGL